MDIYFEKAVKILAKYLPISDEKTRKPILFHDIRVGVYLYERGYSRDIVLAGILHDIIEFTEVSQKTLQDEFGKNVVRLILACTKDDTIEDAKEKTTELIKRCVKAGPDALVIKVADILDSFKFYSAKGNKEQLGYCLRNASAILKYKPANFEDKILDELKSWHNRFLYLEKNNDKS